MSSSIQPIFPEEGTFTLFPLLPLELRRRIWYFTFAPRVLQYSLATTHRLGIMSTPPDEPNTYQQFSSTCMSPPKLPTTLQVCHESRSFALEHYVVSFESTKIPSFLHGYSDVPPRPVYYWPEIDIVAFDKFQDVTQAVEALNLKPDSAYGAAPAFKDVRRVILPGREWEANEAFSMHTFGTSLMPKAHFFTKHFTSLNEILLAMNYNEPRGRSNPGEDVSLGREIIGRRRLMQKHLNSLIRQIPGWTIPIVKIVMSMHDLTEVDADDTAFFDDLTDDEVDDLTDDEADYIVSIDDLREDEAYDIASTDGPTEVETADILQGE